MSDVDSRHLLPELRPYYSPQTSPETTRGLKGIFLNLNAVLNLTVRQSGRKPLTFSLNWETEFIDHSTDGSFYSNLERHCAIMCGNEHDLS